MPVYNLNDEEAHLISERLNRPREQDVFALKDLFTEDEWAALGDGDHRRGLGSRFSRDVGKGRFPGVTWQSIKKSGRDAEYRFVPPH